MADAQPDEGQGNEATTGLYDSYLQFVPPEHHDAARAHLEEVSKSVNSRLEEAASLRSTYEPYTQIPGLDAYQPQELGNLVQWHQGITADPDTFRDWLQAASKEYGLTVEESEALEEAASGTDSEIEHLQQQWQEQLAPVQEQIQQVAQNQFMQSETALVTDRFSQLEAEHNIQFTKEQRDTIVALGLAAMPDDGQSLTNGQDWIGAGFDQFKEVYAQAQTAFVNDKAAAPAPAMSGGATPVFELPKTWEEAKARAGERLRQSRA